MVELFGPIGPAFFMVFVPQLMELVKDTFPKLLKWHIRLIVLGLSLLFTYTYYLSLHGTEVQQWIWAFFYSLILWAATTGFYHGFVKRNR